VDLIAHTTEHMSVLDFIQWRIGGRWLFKHVLYGAYMCWVAGFESYCLILTNLFGSEI
jgi:hypothetical protein